MKKFKILMTLGIILIAVGIGIVLYPHISNAIYENKMHNVVDKYDDNIEQMYNDTDTGDIEREIAEIRKDNPDYSIADYVKDKDITADSDNDKYDWALISLLREEMLGYNANLLENGQYELNDPFAYEQPSFQLYQYSISDNVFGHISAPSIGMDLPIYLGASQYNMNFGAVHLSHSSMPIGGESTNAVFAAHRGYIGRIFFDNIVVLNIGDDVYVTNPWEKLHYKVVETDVISPYDIDRCYIQEGRDLITLLTCHPYGSSRYRYMVICERVEESENE